jgi:catechol 2,3-dioxygenase-like lactoylglutathione lyase family enzyme
MLSDKWDIAHIALVVDDLEAAMTQYADALGFEWSSIIELPPELETKSDVFEGGVSHDGLRAVLSRSGSAAVGDGVFAPLELAHAAPSTPASMMWGCPGGRHFIHHVAYYVDDVDAESAHLRAQGFAREWYVEREDGRLEMVYHRAANGMRFELQDMSIKQRATEFLTHGTPAR